MNSCLAHALSLEDWQLSRLKNHLFKDRLERRLFLAGNPLSLENRQTVGFKVRQYRSGEMSGAMFTTGSRFKLSPPSRSGSISTTKFTQAARNKIRRSVENSALPLNYFLTLTFDTRKNNAWELDENGNVRHDYAKFRLHRLLDALTKHYKRRFNEKLLYVWVAELQKNGNIHFHIMIQKRVDLAYYRKLWKHGSVNVQYLNDYNHAVNYIRKYITKSENATINGNRYNICAELRGTMKPILEENITECNNLEENADYEQHKAILTILQTMKSDIEYQGGIVLDFGFNIPRPRRARFYKDKNGNPKKSKGVNKDLACNVYRLIKNEEEI